MMVRTLMLITIAMLGAGCIAVAPPKTPNQRAAERAAPKVDVPPPSAEATPRPAP
jgi:hypothetical protein